MPGFRPSSQVFPPRETGSYIQNIMQMHLHRETVSAWVLQYNPNTVSSPSHMDSHAICLLSRVIFCERFSLQYASDKKVT